MLWFSKNGSCMHTTTALRLNSALNAEIVPSYPFPQFCYTTNINSILYNPCFYHYLDLTLLLLGSLPKFLSLNPCLYQDLSLLYLGLYFSFVCTFSFSYRFGSGLFFSSRLFKTFLFTRIYLSFRSWRTTVWIRGMATPTICAFNYHVGADFSCPLIAPIYSTLGLIHLVGACANNTSW